MIQTNSEGVYDDDHHKAILASKISQREGYLVIRIWLFYFPFGWV